MRTNTTATVGFHGAAPTAQRANANQAEATDLATVVTLANELRAAPGRNGDHQGRGVAGSPAVALTARLNSRNRLAHPGHRAYKCGQNSKWRLMLRSAKCRKRTRTELLYADFLRRYANSAALNRHDFGRTPIFLNHHDRNNTTSPTRPAGRACGHVRLQPGTRARKEAAL